MNKELKQELRDIVADSILDFDVYSLIELCDTIGVISDRVEEIREIVEKEDK
jgi:hypothetical protein